MPGWRWIPTPGHTEVHVSLFRDEERILIAGDAFTTVKQQSLLSILAQTEQISGPPAYFKTNWEEAEKSVRRLRNIEPSLAIPSHGMPMRAMNSKRIWIIWCPTLRKWLFLNKGGLLIDDSFIAPFSQSPTPKIS